MKKLFLFVAFALCSALSFGGVIRFEKITAASQLANNDSVILVYENLKVANGAASGKQLDSVNIVINSAGEVEMDETKAKSSYLKLIKSGSYWKVMRGTKYMRIKNNSSTNVNTDLNFDTSAGGTTYTYEWGISFSGNDVLFAPNSSKVYGNYEFRYNSDATANYFRPYKLSAGTRYGEAIQLYRRISNQATGVTSVELNKDELLKRVDDAAETLTATVKPSDATVKTVTWGSTNTGVATVNNGTISFVGVGTAKVWVKTTDGDKTDTCYVTVLPKLNTEEATFKAVQKAEYLTEGAKVFFGTSKAGKNYIMGLYASGDNIKKVDATYGTHNVKAQLAYAYTVEKDGDYYLFKDQDGNYLRCEGEKKLKSGTKDEKSRWILGAFDEDDATVQLKSAYYTTNSYYIFNNHSADLFSTYGGVGDGSNLAKTILYSDKAADWVDRVKNKWITVSTDYLDWGDEEKDEYATDYPWDTYRTLTITSNDLTDIIKVELKDDGNGTFYSYGDDFDPTKRTSETFSIDWKAASKGEYNGRLEVRCDELDTTIVVLLHAKAVDTNSNPQDPPQVTASVDHVYLNPNWDVESSDFGYAEATLTFSVKNLQKTLYCTWHRDTQEPWFPYSNEWMTVSININNTDEQLVLNDKLDLGKDDRENVKVTIKVYAYNVGTYNCDIVFRTDGVNFFSIPITVTVSEAPQSDPTGLESIESSEISSQKLIRNGQMLIIRNGEVYSVTGVKIND